MLPRRQLHLAVTATPETLDKWPIRTIHDTAEVSAGARVGRGTKIWHHAQVREDVAIGDRCIIGKGVYVDQNVTIGNDVKVQNGAQLFHGVTVEDGAFIGPGAILTNDRYPRSVTPSGTLKDASDWAVGPHPRGTGRVDRSGRGNPAGRHDRPIGLWWGQGRW